MGTPIVKSEVWENSKILGLKSNEEICHAAKVAFEKVFKARLQEFGKVSRAILSKISHQTYLHGLKLATEICKNAIFLFYKKHEKNQLHLINILEKFTYFSLIISILNISYKYVSYKYMCILKKYYAKIYFSFMSVLLWQKWKFSSMFTKDERLLKWTMRKIFHAFYIVLLDFFILERCFIISL